MSSDPAALQALAVRTKAPLRYFELVKFTTAGHNVTCFLAVGKHALYLVRRNLGGLYPTDAGGQIFFAFIRSMVEDSENSTDLSLLLSESGASAWKSEQLFVSSENRHALAQRIQVAWNTDYIFRFGQVGHLHLSKQSLGGEKEKNCLTVKPFQGCKEVRHSAYRFFVPQSYEAQDHAGHFRDAARAIKLEIMVQEPVPIMDLEAADHDHLRWAALEWKQSIAQSLGDAIITKSSARNKRMNLMNDLCAWTGWEITLRSRDSVLAMVLLRRQFAAPLADAAQDFSIKVTCERWAVDEGKVNERVLLHEARLIADSTMPNTSHCTVPQQMYQDFIQAKLDTLLLPESSLAWTEKSLNLKPSCEWEARLFLKSILKVLHEEHQLSSKVLEDLEAGEDLPPVADPMEAVQRVQLKGPDTPEAQNAWLARVARYFTYCADGALISLSLSTVCNATLTVKPNQKKIHAALLFLLHARPKDPKKPWEAKEIRHLLLDPELFETYQFNNHALQALLEYGWLARQLKPAKAQEKMSLEFAEFLCALLVSPEASQDLKAAICRAISSACSGPIHVTVLVPALSSVLRQRNIFLKTCATVALVNMTGSHEMVKDALIRMDALPMLVEHLRLMDDELIYYTLMLTANLSRTTAQRLALQKAGVVAEILVLLRVLATTPKQQGGQLIAEMASNVGQLCNEEDIMISLVEEKAVPLLIELYELSPPNSRQRAKLMFALRQFCGTSWAEDVRKDVGHLLPKIMEELHGVAEGQPFDSLNRHATDCLVSAVLLLYALAISPSHVEEMRELGFLNILLKLRFSPLKELDATRERITELLELLKGENA